MVTIFTSLGVTIGVFLALALVLIAAEKRLANYGECTVSINDGSQVFEREGGVSLLSALYEKKIFIPSACGGKGSCGYCKVEVKAGGGPILPTETSFMSRPELLAGIRLACQLKIKENLEIVLPEDLLAVKEYRATVSLVKELTYDIKEVNFQLIEPVEIKHRPGQYVQIMAQGPEGPVFRAYSISSPSSKHDGIQLIVRLVPEGIASTYIHNLKEGDEVIFTGPYGEFRLSENPNTEIICVGGGAGMAPISCIIHSIYEKWPDRSCHLYFGCRSMKDVFYLDDFQKLAAKHPNLKIHYALSEPSEVDKWDGDTGFIHLSVDKWIKDDEKRQAFLCGPPPMIDAVTEVLKEKHLKDGEIFYDKF
ncbi:MAG: 2Fe-2S iron-sulfur cluster binding domain-containing protein [Spirochaetales bacterium]|jgi:Na+-transporting NADH:ubiquinone oxidoreductase subunit F|nr:2Fe-2S iron-sulfur cluster binding domain-containing protein [Spirochaetales bacterium]